MRILVLSDTHGHLDLINTLVDKHKADVVIHCGDFGIESANRLLQTPQRELTLRIRHAPPSVLLPDNARKNCFKMTKDEKITLIKHHHLLGEFDAFISGEKKFHVPVYCVWGNHEDDVLVQQLVSKELVVPNLHLVTGSEGVLLDGWIRLVGVGGNLIHWLLFDNQHSNAVSLPSHPNLSIPQVSPFYPSMRFTEWARLFELFNVTNPPPTNKNKTPDAKGHAISDSNVAAASEQLWLVTHISPGKEPTLEWLMYLLSPAFVFSGHMGPYLPQHYSLFTVMDDREWLARVADDLAFVTSVWDERRWSFELWHFAVDLAQQGTGVGGEQNTRYLQEWSTFEEATFERQPGVKTKLIDLYIDVATLQALKSSASPSEFGSKIIELFVSQSPPEDSVNLPSSKDKKKTTTTLPFPNPRVIPTRPELVWLAAQVERYLVVPKQMMPKETQSATDAFLRKPSDIVKQSPQFFNLPDAYMGGYIVVDTNAATQTLTFTSIGTYPQSHIV